MWSVTLCVNESGNRAVKCKSVQVSFGTVYFQNTSKYLQAAKIRRLELSWRQEHVWLNLLCSGTAVGQQFSLCQGQKKITEAQINSANWN